MVILKKILKWFGLILLSILTLLALADALWVFGPQLMTERKISDLNNYAQGVSKLDIPDKTKIIALGEASHGNVEFQELKLAVLQTLVEKEGVKSFALEMDFGEGLLIDDYIRKGQGNLDDIVESLDFTIYRTDQIKKLIEWMKDYNSDKDESQQLSFYGFDMQNPSNGIQPILTYCKNQQIDLSDDDKKTLNLLKQALDQLSDSDRTALIQVLHDIQTKILSDQMTRQAQLISQEINCIFKNLDYYQDYMTDYVSMNNFRDRCMAENVAWIQELEKSRGHEAIMIAGHNGHVALKDINYKTMGQHLEEKFGDQYFVIGTDYFHTKVNINTIGQDIGRGNHSFNSEDPLAAQAKNYGGFYYLDFASVDKEGQTSELISEPMSMGSLGEGYSFLMHLSPNSHRIKQIPKDLYHAMIFVYKANPIHPYSEK